MGGRRNAGGATAPSRNRALIAFIIGLSVLVGSLVAGALIDTRGPSAAELPVVMMREPLGSGVVISAPPPGLLDSEQFLYGSEPALTATTTSVLLSQVLPEGSERASTSHGASIRRRTDGPPEDASLPTPPAKPPTVSTTTPRSDTRLPLLPRPPVSSAPHPPAVEGSPAIIETVLAAGEVRSTDASPKNSHEVTRPPIREEHDDEL